MRVLVILGLTATIALAAAPKSQKLATTRSHSQIADDLAKAIQDPTLPADVRAELEKVLIVERCESSIENTSRILKSVGISEQRILQWQEEKRKSAGCGA